MSGRPGSARVTMKKHVYLLPGREETFADNLAKSIESLGLTLCGREIVRDFARLRFAEQLALIKSDLQTRSEEHTSELQSQSNLVCRLLLEKKKYIHTLLCTSIYPNISSILTLFDSFPDADSLSRLSRSQVNSALKVVPFCLYLDLMSHSAN